MQTPRTILFKLRWSLIHRGLRDTLRRALHRLTNHPDPPHIYNIHPFDIQHNVDTSGMLDALQLHSLYATAYHGIPPSRFRAILSAWLATPPQHPIESYTFIDLGCGKGRAVLLATELPFREVLGVELNPALAQIASSNLDHWQATGRANRPARVFCHDATSFPLPTNPCVLFLYNPFAEPSVRQLIQHLATAPTEAIDILYFTPDSGHLFAQHPNFTTLWTAHIPISPEDAAAEPITEVEDLCTAFRRTEIPTQPGAPYQRQPHRH